MKKLIALFFVVLFTISAKAQKNSTASPTSPIQPFGKVDKEDLEMKSCDFEKDANAEVLFDKGVLTYYGDRPVMRRHVRIKIFNEFGKNAANVKLYFYDYKGLEIIDGLHAETINIVNEGIKITPVSAKLIYTKKVNKYITSIAFLFPEVRAGSIIEYTYNWKGNNLHDMPTWYFQGLLPTRYSEFDTHLDEDPMTYREVEYVNQPYIKHFGDSTTKSQSITMPDRSITFKRIASEQDGTIVLRYSIIFKKSIYPKDDYPEFYEFFKRTYEMLNEQIVLKKI